MLYDITVFSASLYTIGSLVGSLMCGMLSSLVGRKKVMILANLLSAIGFLFLRFANKVKQKEIWWDQRVKICGNICKKRCSYPFGILNSHY